MSTNIFFVRNILGCYQNSNQSHIFCEDNVISKNLKKWVLGGSRVNKNRGIDVNVFNKILLKL